MVFTDIDEFSVPAIYGIFVSPDASPDGTPFRISDKEAFISSGARPSVALDTDKGIYLVAWHDWRSGNPDIYGSILNSTGLHEGRDFAIASGAHKEKYPLVAFSPEAGGFMAAWEDSRSGDIDIYTRAITLEGRDRVEAVKGPEMVAYKAPGDQAGTSIAYFNDQDLGAYYFLAFEDSSPDAPVPAISGQIINAVTGKALMPVKLGLDISGSRGGHAPSVTSSAYKDIPFLVAWHGPQGELRARYMDTSGSSLEPFDRVFEPEGAAGAAGRVRASSDPSTGRSALFWQESAGDLHDIYASFIEPGDTSGSVYHVMQVAGDDQRDEINLDVSYNSRMPSFLVAYESTDYLTSFNILLTSVTDPDYPEISVQDPVYPFEDLSVTYPGVLFNTSVSHTLSVYNDSPYSGLRILDINSTGPFTVAGENCTLSSLAPSGEPCSVTVEFSPGVRGPMSGSLSILSDDPNEPRSTVHLAGESIAPVMEITDTSMPGDDMLLDFGFVRPGTVSEGTLTIRNRGSHVLTLDRIRDAYSPGFGISEDNCSLQALYPWDHCTVVLYASPEYEGRITGGVWIISDDPEKGEVFVKLSAEGARPSIDATGSAGGLGFGGVQSGQSSKRELVVRNSGGVPLNIYSIDRYGEAFSIDPGGCEGAALGPGEACTIHVSFRAKDTLSHTGSITINSDSPDTPATSIPISGFGAVPIASVHAEGAGGRLMEFEALETGRALTRSVRLTNIGGAPLSAGQPSISGGGFSIAYDGCSGKALRYAASCDIMVRFTPAGSGSYSGRLLVPTNDPQEGETGVSLSGAGI
jgi:hypothetical protein